MRKGPSIPVALTVAARALVVAGMPGHRLLPWLRRPLAVGMAWMPHRHAAPTVPSLPTAATSVGGGMS